MHIHTYIHTYICMYINPLRGAGCRFPDFRSYIEGILLMCLLKPPHHKNECSVTTEG